MQWTKHCKAQWWKWVVYRCHQLYFLWKLSPKSWDIFLKAHTKCMTFGIPFWQKLEVLLGYKQKHKTNSLLSNKCLKSAPVFLHLIISDIWQIAVYRLCRVVAAAAEEDDCSIPRKKHWCYGAIWWPEMKGSSQEEMVVLCDAYVMGHRNVDKGDGQWSLRREEIILKQLSRTIPSCKVSFSVISWRRTLLHPPMAKLIYGSIAIPRVFFHECRFILLRDW